MKSRANPTEEDGGSFSRRGSCFGSAAVSPIQIPRPSDAQHGFHATDFAKDKNNRKITLVSNVDLLSFAVYVFAACN